MFGVRVHHVLEIGCLGFRYEGFGLKVQVTGETMTLKRRGCSEARRVPDVNPGDTLRICLGVGVWR